MSASTMPRAGAGRLLSAHAPRARLRRFLAALLVVPLAVLAACAGGGASGGSNVISYWLWDSSQQPGYQKCADAFAKENPGLRVAITQYGWGDYWQKLTAGFIADTAPDVFTDHLSKFAQFVDLKVLYSLDELEPTKDIQDDDFQEGLAELWKGQDGQRYGAPKDWDTIAIFYDKKKLAEAGITPAQLETLTWNRDDGGTFEKVVAHLSVDANGVRGDEPGFDKRRVKQFGWASDGSGEGWGQTQWSPFTGSLGWQATDKNPWGTRFNLDDPQFQKAIDWYFGLVDKGFMPSYAQRGGANGVSPDRQLQTGLAVMGFNGSWMLSSYAGMTDANGKKIEVGIAPVPTGPKGRASMFNGLADSITKQARDPIAAAKWVKFLSSAACQNIIGASGAVFPARPEATEIAVAFNKKERGMDVTPFTDLVKKKETFLFPVTNYAADILALNKPVFDAIYLRQENASALTGLNTQLDRLFEVSQ